MRFVSSKANIKTNKYILDLINKKFVPIMYFAKKKSQPKSHHTLVKEYNYYLY